MKVRILEPLNTPHGEIPAGRIITVPDYLLERLRGKIEIVEDPFTFRGAVEIVTPKGEIIWIPTDPEAVKMIPEGMVYFVGDEIKQLQKVGQEVAWATLLVKQVFPGAVLKNVEVGNETNKK